MRNRIKHIVYIIVLIGFSLSHAGSYEDFFTAIQHDDADAVQTLLARGFDPNTDLIAACVMFSAQPKA